MSFMSCTALFCVHTLRPDLLKRGFRGDFSGEQHSQLYWKQRGMKKKEVKICRSPSSLVDEMVKATFEFGQ